MNYETGWNGEWSNPTAYWNGANSIFYTNYQYLATESGCCYSYWAVRSLRPGTMGWTLTSRTVPVEDETWKRALKPPYEQATYEIPLMTEVDE